MAINPQQALAAALAGASARIDQPVVPRFKPGARVHLRNINPTGHTRMPRYIRDKHGTIERDHGVFVFPDTYAVGKGEKPQHVYLVRFTAQELWGDAARSNDELLVDVWDDYLEPA
jgi:nitrile hydratase subunit beta